MGEQRSHELNLLCVVQERLVSGGLMEAARASWWHSSFLRTAGAKIGRGVYFDTMSFSVRLPARTSLLEVL